MLISCSKVQLSIGTYCLLNGMPPGKGLVIQKLLSPGFILRGLHTANCFFLIVGYIFFSFLKAAETKQDRETAEVQMHSG